MIDCACVKQHFDDMVRLLLDIVGYSKQDSIFTRVYLARIQPFPHALNYQNFKLAMSHHLNLRRSVGPNPKVPGVH